MNIGEFIQSWGLIILAAILNSYTSLIVKYRFNQLGEMELRPLKTFIAYILNFFKSFLVITAILAFLISPVLFFTALNKIQFSIGYPLFCSFQLTFTVVSGILLLKEKLSFNKIGGLLLLLTSLYLFYNL